MKKIFYYLIFIAVIGVIAAIFLFGRSKEPLYNTVTAERKNIVQEVSVTGRVEPAQSVELAFEVSGRVAAVNVRVGDKVSSGKILASLDTTELQAQLLKYQANLESEQAVLNELKKGSRPEEIELYRAKVSGAETNFEDAKSALINSLQDAYTKSDDAVRNKVDQFFINPRTQSPQISFPVNDSALKVDIEWGRLILESSVFPEWRAMLNRLTISSGLPTYANDGKKYLEQVKTFLENVALAINNPNNKPQSISQTTFDAWRVDVSASRVNINAAVTSLATAYENFKTAESNLAVAESELKLKEAGATTEQIDSQQAKIRSALAEVENARAQIAKRILRSPLNGVVTKMDAKVGEIAAANTILISIISATKFEIEADVPEADIAKVKISNKARVTLDAYGEDIIFEAQVVTIDPAETIIEGVAAYKTTLQFAQDDERIKSGMTANLDILTDSRTGVIVVPQRTIIARNGDKLIRVLRDKTFEERKITIGLRGSDGNVEIIEGVKEGEKIITP